MSGWLAPWPRRASPGCSMDFLVAPKTRPAIDDSRDDPDVLLCEINMRLGGTTHLSGPRYLRPAGLMTGRQATSLPTGTRSATLSTDNLTTSKLYGQSPADVIARLGCWAFDPGSRTGSVLHMLGAAKDYGKVGVTAIGNSPDEAERTYRATRQALSV